MGEGLAAGHSDGVDRSQIRRMLALTPLERIRHMIDVANGMAQFRDRIGRAERRIFEPEPRDKDLAALPYLEALQQEVQRGDP